jgi:hypothetical protein
VLVYRTRVPGSSWYDPEKRAALLERLDAEERRVIGYDQSRVSDEGVILLISVDK